MNTQNVEIFNNWGQELAYRGTDKIKRTKSTINGCGVIGNSPLILNNELNIGLNWDLTFEVKMGSFPYLSFDILVDTTNDSKITFSEQSINFRLSATDNVFSMSHPFITNTFYKVRIVRLNDIVYFYLNDVLLGSVNSIAAYFNIITYLLSGLNYPAANFKIITFDSDLTKKASYEWKCNEACSVYVNEKSGYYYSAYFNISFNTNYTNIWKTYTDGTFGNIEISSIDGELPRLIKYDGFEYLFEMVNNSELGLCIDQSSPISQEANCVNLNKAYHKGDIIRLSDYPLIGTSVPTLDTSGYINFTVSGTSLYSGINYNSGATGLYATTALTPFIPIPIDKDGRNFVGYEISFVINSAQNIYLLFGVNGYNSSLTFLDNSGTSSGLFKQYQADTVSSLFLSSADFSLCKNRDLLIRAVLTCEAKNGGAPNFISIANQLNINDGYNLYIDYSSALTPIKYITPFINFKQASAISPFNVKMKDIVVRPLELGTEKGFINNKNKIFGYVRNNSGKFNDEVYNFIDEKLVPINCVTHINNL